MNYCSKYLLLLSLVFSGCKVPVPEEISVPEKAELPEREMEVPVETNEPDTPTPALEPEMPKTDGQPEAEPEKVAVDVGSEKGLTDDGKAAWASHRELFSSVLEKYPHTLTRQVNADVPILSELVIYDDPEGINLVDGFKIPADLINHMSRFSRIVVEGEHLVKVSRPQILLGGNTLQLRGEKRNENQVVVLTRGMPQGPGLEGSWVFKLSGSGVAKRIRLTSAGIFSKFDRTPFMSDRAQQGSRTVEVKVSAITGRTIQGVGALSRERYFRIYEIPGIERTGLVEDLKKKGFVQGRQIIKLRSALEERTWDRNGPKLQEDPNRPGFADLDFFKAATFENYRGIDRDFKFAMCFDNWPSWMDVMHPSGDGRGTPKNFVAAAELAAAYVKADLKNNKLTATWWEVKNESDIIEEWAYHKENSSESWKLLADFHNEMAKTIHKETPSVKVGGPTSAWFHPEKGSGGFKQWKTHSTFMDDTREHLDFYAHHVYDSSIMDTYKGLWSGYSGYAQGKLESTVDMLKAHMIATDNVKPLVVSEHGSLNGERGPADYWVRIKAYNHNLITFMDRPADFAITVPFLLGFTHWEPNSGHGLIDVDEDQNYRFNDNIHFVNMWEGVKGHRLFTLNDEKKLFVRSFLDGEDLYVALNNRSGDLLAVDLALQLPPACLIDEAIIRSVRFEDEELKYIDQEFAKDLKQIPLNSEETAVLHIKLNREVSLARLVNETSCYAVDTVVSASGSVKYSINVPSKALSSKRAPCVLRVGLFRSGGYDGDLEVKFNGKPYTVDLKWTKGIETYFDYVEFTIPPSDVRVKNEVVVKAPDSGGYITSSKLVLRTLHTAQVQ